MDIYFEIAFARALSLLSKKETELIEKDGMEDLRQNIWCGIYSMEEVDEEYAKMVGYQAVQKTMHQIYPNLSRI